MFISPSPSVSVPSVQAPHLQPSRAAEKASVIWWGMSAQTFNNDDKNVQKQTLRLFNYSRQGNGIVLIKWQSWHCCWIIMRGLGVVDWCDRRPLWRQGDRGYQVWQVHREKQLQEVRWEQILGTDSASEPPSSVFLSQPPSGHSSCGVCCPMNFPKASSLRLPKMLLNGSPFHSPVQLLMAFSSRKAAQLNQQEAFGQRKGAGKCLQHRGRCFSFLTKLDKCREKQCFRTLFLCYCNPLRQQECSEFL